MSQQQHVQMFRKLLLRKRLLRWALDGPAYVPFIGDGDIASELYADRIVYGADLDRDRVKVARSRLVGDIRVADCDGWPFHGLRDELAIADFDAYVNPYPSFHAFWHNARKPDRLVMFFTDGIKQAVIRSGVYTRFDGTVEHIPVENVTRKRQIYNAYLSRHVWPAFEDAIKPWRVIDRMRYLRQHITYWGAVIERG